MPFALTRAESDRRVGWPTLVGVLLVPLLLAAGFLYASWDSSHRLDHVRAAVVNLDEPVTIKDQVVPLGRQLAGGLVTSGHDEAKTDQNYDWVLSDEADAAAGLRSGAYAAVVTIPKNFSAAATSYGGDAAKAQQATIDVQTSSATAIVDPGLSQAIVSAAVASLNTQLTSSYLDNVYLGFNQQAKQLSTVADAAGKLSDGAGKLSDGVDQTDAGAAELADGMRQLSTGGATLATNVTSYTDGVSQTSTGITKLAGGVDDLADGARQLNAGVPKLGAGAQQLATGADRLADSAPALVTGAGGLATGTAGVSTGLQTYQQALTSGAIPCPAQLDAAACPAFQAGLQAAAQGLGDQKTGLIAGASQVSTGAQAYAAGLKGDGTTKNPGLTTATRGLATGAQGIANGINGTKTTPGLVAGTKGLATGAATLADGTDQLATGAKQLATGGTKLADGVTTYTDGVTASATGTQQLSTGIGKLATGADGLAKGTQQLSDGLAKGADAVPTYTTSERSKLSTVVADPVAPPAANASGAFSDVSAIAYLLAIALWVGALTTFLVLGTGVRRAWASTRPSALLALRGLAPAVIIGVVQAGVLGSVAAALLDLSTARSAGLIGLASFAALAFAAINYALVALFGGVGRFVSVALVVASAAGALLSAVPAFFITLRPVLPLSPVMDGLKAVAGDGSGVGTSVAGLLGWFVIALVAAVLAVVRRRQLRADRVLEAVRV